MLSFAYYRANYELTCLSLWSPPPKPTGRQNCYQWVLFLPYIPTRCSMIATRCVLSNLRVEHQNAGACVKKSNLAWYEGRMIYRPVSVFDHLRQNKQEEANSKWMFLLPYQVVAAWWLHLPLNAAVCCTLYICYSMFLYEGCDTMTLYHFFHI